jgi:hypothetical protein
MMGGWAGVETDGWKDESCGDQKEVFRTGDDTRLRQ